MGKISSRVSPKRSSRKKSPWPQHSMEESRVKTALICTQFKTRPKHSSKFPRNRLEVSGLPSKVQKMESSVPRKESMISSPRAFALTLTQALLKFVLKYLATGVVLSSENV